MIDDLLRKIPLFANMPEADLNRIWSIVEEMDLPAGEQLFEEGSVGDRVYVIRAGQLEIFKNSSGREVLLAVRGPGDVIGEMSLMLDEAPRMATVRARTPSQLMVINQKQFNQLLDSSPSAMRAMLETVLSRWRENYALLRQSEKMAQIGTLVAGVAHELNNPSAAIQRSTEQLQATMLDLNRHYDQLYALGLEPAQLAVLQALAAQIPDRIASAPRLDTLARVDRETEIEIWLDARGIPTPWEYASTLVSLGYEARMLNELADRFAGVDLVGVIRWYSAVYTAQSLMSEIQQSAERLSGIVKALKSYSFLDQALVQVVDLHEGLDNTLTILRHKMKGIDVRREYDLDLPSIEAHGSELNQVWTNLLDNAADALNGRGVIIIRTRQEADQVVVEIEDNGPGIPETVLPRIFEAFFTTKPPGKGTGLGLDISYKIVVLQHQGDIRVSSEPGKTCFQVWLPLSRPSAGG
ncbi:MAG: cyclic nucleotide-binding domain-containing protein [Anaerolineae bacterium]|nr:cyclic nucleotide-binding domain-containing protein [Anaerolineae bacterium]